MLAREGYTEDSWIIPFQKETGCKVSVRYLGPGDDTTTLLAQGSYDVVSLASEDIPRLAEARVIRPLDTSLIPHLGSLRPALRAIPALDRGGAVLGVPYQWGPNLLIWNPRVVAKAPISWNALYIKRNAGRVSIPDDPIQIADAALLAGAQHPSLHIRSPFQLSERQLRSALKLLKRQKAHLAEQVGRGLGPGQRVRERGGDDRRRLGVRGARAAQTGRPRALRDPAGGCDGVAGRVVARLHRVAPRLRLPVPRLRHEGVGAGEDVAAGRRGAGLAGRLPPAGDRDLPRARLRAGPRLRAPALPHDAGHVVPGRPALHERRALERGLGASLGLTLDKRAGEGGSHLS